MQLPPCVKRDLNGGDLQIAAAFFKTQGFSVVEVAKAVGNDVQKVATVLDTMTTAPAFTCEWVKKVAPDFCDEEMCPLKQPLDPLEQAKMFVDTVTYIEDDDNLVISFRNSNKKMVVGYEWALLHPRQFAIRFSANVHKVFHIDFELAHIDHDTGRIDYSVAKDFAKWLMDNATYVPASDAYGLGEVVLNIVQSNRVYRRPEIRGIDPEEVVVIYEERNESKYLLIDAVRFRMRLRAVFGAQAMNAWRINSLLGKFGITVKRISVAYTRKIFYSLNEKTFRELTGMELEEVVGDDEWEDVLAGLSGESGKGVNQ